MDHLSLLIQSLKESAQEAHRVSQENHFNEITKKRNEEAQLSSSKSPEQETQKQCEEKCKYKKLLEKFSPELLAKIFEYNLDPNGFSPVDAVRKLLTLGMPVEHVVVELSRSGSNMNGVKSYLTQHGISGQFNIALAKGLENRSSASSIAYIDGLLADSQPDTNPKQFDQTA